MHHINLKVLSVHFFLLIFSINHVHAEGLFNIDVLKPINPQLQIESKVGRTFSDKHNQYQDEDFSSTRIDIKSEWMPTNNLILKEKVHAISVSGFDNTSYNQILIDELTATYNTSKDCSFKVGYQNVIWGQADRLRVVNVINPLDLRESYYNDWDKKYLSLGMLNSECSFSQQSLQILIIPETKFYKLPDITNYYPNNFTPSTSVTKQSYNDWNTGVRWSSKFSSTDLSLYGYHGYEQIRHPVITGINAIELQANKYTMLGADFSSTLGPFTLRGEFAAKNRVSPRPINNLPSTINFYDESLDKKINQELYLLGIDYPGSNWNFSAQYLNVVNHGVLNALENQKIMTLAGQKYLLNNRLTLEAFSAIDLKNTGNNYLSLAASYEINNHLLAKVTTEFFKQDELDILDDLKFKNRLFLSVILNN